MTPNTLHDRIRRIISERIEARRMPYHVMYRELLSRYDRETLNKELKQLLSDGHIHIGRTINDYYITLKEQEK